MKHDYKDLIVYAPESEQEIIELVPQADIILANPPLCKKYINQTKEDVRVQSTFAWVDAFMHSDLRKDYQLTNVKDTYGPIMSEYIFWYILSKEKSINHFFEKQKQKKRSPFPQPSLETKKIGILWTGSIGSYMAKVAKIFGMKTVWLSSSWAAKDFFDIVYKSEDIVKFCEDLDYMINVLPNTADTYEFIDHRFRKALPNKCYFINVGRWTNVHDEDLIEAINDEMIWWAVLDVFHIEPLPKDHPFWTTPNILVTPHISWYTESFERIMQIFCDNYEKYISGEDLLYKIDFTKGY